MASPLGPAPGPAGGSEPPPGTPVMLPDGWVGKVTAKIVSTVDSVRSKTTTPIEKVGRAVIWGLLIATAGIALLVALTIGVLRLLYEVAGRIPGIDGRAGRNVWIIDVLIGVALLLFGLLLIRRGTKPQHKD